jgi:hypothetical protein
LWKKQGKAMARKGLPLMAASVALLLGVPRVQVSQLMAAAWCCWPLDPSVSLAAPASSFAGKLVT